ncbi:MAG: preprotein translocase subunit SecY [Candidatus Diapherotrites archaeon]|nr:preprotein translocase subunit SecY [Candidatus Diapherotrites archaeon]
MSVMEVISKICAFIPEVKRPEVEPPLKKRIMWSAIALLIFFIMGNIPLIGLAEESKTTLIQFQEVLASRMGTLLTAGIGPIVLASIMLQLLIGAKIIEIDLADPRGRATFQSLQKLAAILFCFFEGFAYPLSGWIRGDPIILGLQIALGSIVLFYLDDLVGKHGIGSGIGLFIAGGVTSRFFWQAFRPFGIGVEEGGLIPTFITSWFAGQPQYILLLPLIISLIIFLVVTYAHAMHVNIPITMGRKGLGGRYPVRLLYVSVIPVILAVALFANFVIIASVVKDVPVAGDIMRYLCWATGTPIRENLYPSSGAGHWAKFNTSVYNLFGRVITQIGASGFGALFEESMLLNIIQGILYMIFLIIFCIIFGKFWVLMGGQSPEDIANQLESSGMYIPGFRRDRRVIVKILNRYIPTITVLGSIFVALLAGIGNMALGALASGTGILLTVGIVYNLYEQLARMQLKEAHPLLKKLLR